VLLLLVPATMSLDHLYAPIIAATTVQ
jgi:hypothetical protein